MKIINIKEAALGEIALPQHPCMPDLGSLLGAAKVESWLVVDGRRLMAVSSLWTEGVSSFEGHRTALLGHFFAEDEHAGALMLHHAAVRLKEQGYGYLIGPINGSTWRSYRLVTDAGDGDPFFMEYYTPSTWPRIFLGADFKEIATYSSAKCTEKLDHDAPSAAKFEARMTDLKISLRTFNTEEVEAELRAVYELSLRSFSRNFLYTSISFEDFCSIYKGILPYIEPDFFLLAAHEDRLVGFVFGVPDYLQKQRGKPIDTVIIKTLARMPDHKAYSGLGGYLLYQIHKRASSKNMSNVIHALMRDNNAASFISQKSAKTMRRYAVYGKAL